MFDDYGSICDLLLHAQLLDETQIAPVMTACAEKGVTSGQYLVESGTMPAPLVRAAILSLAMGRERLLPTKMAIRALRLMAEQGLGFEEALSNCGFRKAYYEHIKLVTNLLVRSQSLSRHDRDTAYNLCMAQELPLLQILASRHVITERLGDVVLVVERLIMSEVLSFERGVEMVKIARVESLTADKALLRGGHGSLVPKSIRLGDLFRSASVVAPDALLACVEIALYNRALLGEVLAATGTVDKHLLDAAIMIQRKVNDALLSPDEGIGQLAALHELQNPKFSFGSTH